MTLLSIALAYYSVMGLQIDQHRAWILYTWVYASCIITLRLYMLAANAVLFHLGEYYFVEDCDEIFADYVYLGIPDQANPAFQSNPACASRSANANVDRQTVVPINTSTPEVNALAFQLTFRMAF